MMNLRYYSSYNDVNNKLITINIYKEGYEGTAEKFTLAADPVTINYECNDVFKPIKYSGCTIRLVTPKILEDLYTGKVTDVYIEILKDGQLFWRGYNTPNIYNQEWVTDLDATSIEGIDTLSALQYFDFEYSDYGKENIIDFFSEIKRGLEITNRGYLKLTYRGLLDNNNSGLLAELKLMERNFYDESENPLKWNEVLEHILQFLNCTLIQWKGEYIISDNESAYKDGVNTFTYNSAIPKNPITLGVSNFNPKHYEVGENASTVSYGDVYNQVNVIGNLMEIEDTQLSFDDMKYSRTYKEMDSNGNSFVTIVDTAGRTGKRIFYQFVLNDKWSIRQMFIPDFWSMNIYLSKNDAPIPLDNAGGTFMREAKILPKYIAERTILDAPWYSVLFDTKSTLEWKYYFTYHTGNKYERKNITLDTFNSNPATIVLSRKLDNVVSYPQHGYFILHANLGFSRFLGRESYYCDDVEEYVPFLEPPHTNYRLKYKQPKTDEELYEAYFTFKAKLRVGNKYYNGSSWQDTECTFTFDTEHRYYDNERFGDYKNEDFGDDWEVLNTNSFIARTKSNTEGWLIPITEDLCGNVEFSLYDSVITPDWDKIKDETEINYIQVNDFQLEYTPNTFTSPFEIYDEEEGDKDLKYSQLIDNNNVTEYNDITLYLNTYNPELCNKLSYSYVFDVNNKYLQMIEKDGTVARPEQHIVKAYATHYGSPKIIHSNIIKNKEDITPLDVIWVNSLGKYLSVGSINYNITFNNAEVNLYEL